MFLTDFEAIYSTIITTALLGLAVSAVIYAIFSFITRKRFSAPIYTHILRYLFLTYLVCILILTLSPQSADLDAKANFFPLFSVVYALNSGFETAQYLVILNIIMFVPMGVFLPCVFKKADKLYKTVLISFAATLSIEIIQVLLSGRVFDIDDILLNTLGSAIGYALFAICIWILKKREQKNITRILSLFVLSIIPIFLLIFNIVTESKEFKYSSFNFYAGMTDDIEVQYDEEIPNTADVYSQTNFEPYSEIKKLMQLFEIDGEITESEDCLSVTQNDKELSQAKFRNSWQCVLRTPTKQELNIEETEQMEETARNILKEYGLWHEEAQILNIEDDYIDINGNYPYGFSMDEDPITGELIPPKGVILSGKIVSFYFDDKEDSWSASINIDSKGGWRIAVTNNHYDFYRKVELISPKEAINALRFSDKCYVEFTDIDNIVIEPYRIVIDNISITYTYGNNLKYNLPAWKLEGEFFGMDYSDDGTLENKSARGYIIVEAIKQ